MSDLVKRLSSFASGCRGSMWQSRDETIALLEEAASRIEALEAENARLREVVDILPHIRYLAGCACGEGDFSDEPPASPAEWKKVLLNIEDVLTEYEEPGQ